MAASAQTIDSNDIGLGKEVFHDCSDSETREVYHLDSGIFDCFLSHNSRDKPAVRTLAKDLRDRGIAVWLDEDFLRPGVTWQPLLEAGIRTSNSVAVLVGASGLGPWEVEEMLAALLLAVRDKKPVIPVLLADATAEIAESELPLFLQNRTWVDMRGEADSGNLSPLDRLIWGITGVPPDRKAHRQRIDRNDDDCRKDFFGRQDEKNHILGHLRVGSHEPILVRGERRMGKTSMLRLIEAALKEGQYAKDFIVPRRLHVAYYRDARTLANELAAILTTVLGIPDCEPFPAGIGFRVNRCIIAFRDMLKDVTDKTVVFILDELDEMLEESETIERLEILSLFRALRGHGLPLKFLCSLIRIPARLSREVEIFVSECTVIELDPLPPSDFEDMVRTLTAPGPRLSGKDLDLIYRQSGGWPFFAKVILWYLVTEPAGRGRLNRALKKAAEDRKDGRLALAMTQVFAHHFNSDEQMLVSVLSDSENPTTLSELIRASSRNPDTPCWLPGAADRLIDRDYLQREGDGVVFRVGLLGPWFRSRKLRLVDPAFAKRKRTFRVALSYAHQQREFVAKVSDALQQRFGEHQLLYDEYLSSRFSRADLDEYLPELFRTESDLVIVFWCGHYPLNEWTKREWEAIRIVLRDDKERVMFFRFDRAPIDIPGYIDIPDKTDFQFVVKLIVERYESPDLKLR